MMSVRIRMASAVLMSTHNIQFNDKKISLYFCFLELSEEFCRVPKTSSNYIMKTCLYNFEPLKPTEIKGTH